MKFNHLAQQNIKKTLNTLRLFFINFLMLIVGCVTPSTLSYRSSHLLKPYEDHSLKNGLKVILVEDRSLPALSVSLLVKVGSAQDPQDLSGLSSFVAEMLDKGTRHHSSIDLSDEMALYSMDFQNSTQPDFSILSASALSFYEDQLIRFFTEIITEPSFSNDEIERQRRKLLAQLKQSVDDPELFTDLVFDSILYKGHPYHHPVFGWAREVRKISKKHITRHYLQYYRPGNAMLAITGSYSPHILEKLEQAFAGWENRGPIVTRPHLSLPQNQQGLQIEVLNRDDLQQAQIRFGHLGLERKNIDFLPVQVANTILSFGMSSRLMKEIREQRGLTYSIHSNFDARFDLGSFIISTSTRHEKIGETVTETLRVLTNFVNQGITQEELNEAKAALRGQFPRTLERPESLAAQLLSLRFFEVPDSYLSHYLKNVEQLTVQKISQVIQQYFHPKDCKILVYAPQVKAVPQLQHLGPIKVHQYREFL